MAPDQSEDPKKPEVENYVPWGTPGNVSESLNDDQARMDNATIRTPLVPDEFDDRDPRVRRRADPLGLDWPETLPGRERLIALALGALAALAAWFTAKGYGLAWDEAYYYQPSIDVAGWIGQLLTLQPGWASEASVNLGFGRTWELPPVVKVLQAISWSAFAANLGELRALRLPSAILFGLSTSLVYGLGWLAGRRMAALVAALAFATMPVVFGHAHFAASETATIFMLLFAIWVSLRGLRSNLWAVLTALAVALAFVTKINAVFLPVILLPWALIHARKQSASILFAVLILTIPAIFLLWPWMWHDTLAKFLSYARFAMKHDKIGTYFLGTRYNFTEAAIPMYYPAFMLAITMPPLTLITAALGALMTVFRPTRRGALPQLYLWAFVVFLGVASLPTTPRYDGVRLFMPVMPFAALLAGLAVAWIAQALQSLRRVQINARAVALGAAAAIAIAGVVDIARIHPHELSYYNAFVGGIEGAESRGFEVSYWGESLDRAALDEMNKRLPQGARIKSLALNDLSWPILQQWGWLRRDLRFDDAVSANESFDYHLIQNRRGLWGRAEMFLAANYQPMAVWGKNGVPLMMLYHTPGGLGAQRPAPKK